MNNQNEETKEEEQPIGETYSTVCNPHLWIEDAEQDPNSDLTSVRCAKCWSGASINPSEVNIVDGKLVPCQKK